MAERKQSQDAPVQTDDTSHIQVPVTATEENGADAAHITQEHGVIPGTDYSDNPDKPHPTSVAQVQEVPDDYPGASGRA